jgi:hypothetical protein
MWEEPFVVPKQESLIPQTLPELAEAAPDALGGSEPFVLRGVAAHWPVVQAARQGSLAVLDYLKHCAAPGEIEFSLAPPALEGRFHYTADMRGFTFVRRSAPLGAFLDALAAAIDDPQAPAMAAQGILTDIAAPRFAAEQPLPHCPGEGQARLWIGNRARVAAHSDPADNIAYCAAGHRRFTLFAPEQAANLYLGPFDPTPAGTPIAMTDPLKPDLDRYPRFAQAMTAALVTELEPGDAIYIPYGWFHHVQALSPVSMLVNYWWRQPEPGGSPWDALLMGMMALRQLPPNARRHWQAMFETYVFEKHGPAGAHLPPHVRGVLDARGPGDLAAMRAALQRKLAGPGPR